MVRLYENQLRMIVIGSNITVELMTLTSNIQAQRYTAKLYVTPESYDWESPLTTIISAMTGIAKYQNGNSIVNQKIAAKYL